MHHFCKRNKERVEIWAIVTCTKVAMFRWHASYSPRNFKRGHNSWIQLESIVKIATPTLVLFDKDEEEMLPPTNPPHTDSIPWIDNPDTTPQLKTKYSQNSLIPYLLVDSSGYGFSEVMGWRGWEKSRCPRKLTEISRKSYFLCYNRSTGPEGKHSMPFGQVLIDGFLFNIVGFMIEQRLIWNLMMNRSINLVLW